MIKSTPIERWIVNPASQFMSNSTSSGIVLFITALVALALSNSPLANDFHNFWEIKFKIGFGDFVINKSLQHWINDGLMSMFFFVVGLELKREIIAGELANPRNAILPFIASLGGFLLPALIYFLINFNASDEAMNGWGVPMATDIAFALGVLYLLGDRVPLSLKIFLTVLAIIDDLGAVLVIAIFYTSEISFISLSVGGLFLGLMILANYLGARSSIFYGIMGIGGLWLAFLLSGVHATIAAVLAAFTIPANIKISKKDYLQKVKVLIQHFEKEPTTEYSTISPKQQTILYKIKGATIQSLTPLQKLEHSLHTLVAFVVMPLFALANAGITFSGEVIETLTSPVTLGIIFGLLCGKVMGISGAVWLGIKSKLVQLPEDISFRHIIGISFLAAIGFTMSLFITGLAFRSEDYILQAKLGILIASLVAGTVGYIILHKTLKK